MQKNYLIAAFEQTAAERFPAQGPELCRCFCDSDDITYDGLHPKLLWHRTKTLGRGNDCCDFGLMIQK